MNSLSIIRPSQKDPILPQTLFVISFSIYYETIKLVAFINSNFLVLKPGFLAFRTNWVSRTSQTDTYIMFSVWKHYHVPSWLEMYIHDYSLVPLAFLEYYGLGKGHYSYLRPLEKLWLDHLAPKFSSWTKGMLNDGIRLLADTVMGGDWHHFHQMDEKAFTRDVED